MDILTRVTYKPMIFLSKLGKALFTPAKYRPVKYELFAIDSKYFMVGNNTWEIHYTFYLTQIVLV